MGEVNGLWIATGVLTKEERVATLRNCSRNGRHASQMDVLHHFEGDKASHGG